MKHMTCSQLFKALTAIFALFLSGVLYAQTAAEIVNKQVASRDRKIDFAVGKPKTESPTSTSYKPKCIPKPVMNDAEIAACRVRADEPSKTINNKRITGTDHGF